MQWIQVFAAAQRDLVIGTDGGFCQVSEYLAGRNPRKHRHPPAERNSAARVKRLSQYKMIGALCSGLCA